MIDYEQRAMIEAEDKYTFRQSSQLSSQTGLIGFLRADFGSDGNSFFSTWNDWRDDLKTDTFKQELDEVINTLREDGDILHSRNALSRYCHATPQSRMQTALDYYGVRVDTGKYTYLLRLNPNEGEYNLYCYCYVKEWLDKHLQKAEKGIRFITPDYKDIFRLKDGDRIRIIRKDGDTMNRRCRYIDDFHVEVGDYCFHICEFAEKMQGINAKVIPLRSSLPEQCYVYVKSENVIGYINKGDSGYIKTDIAVIDADDGMRICEEKNKILGVTKAQAAAMVAGSMFGWETPAADPKNYDASGKAIKPNERRDCFDRQ